MWTTEDHWKPETIEPLSEVMPDLLTIRDKVLEVGGAAPLPTGLVRNACGAQSLGSKVRDKIAAALDEVGLGFLGEEIPKNQCEPLLLYVKDHPVGRIVDAVLDPSKAGAKLLRRAARGMSE